MLDRLRTIDADEDTNEEGLKEYAAELRWYIGPGKTADYSTFRGVCFFPPQLVWNQGTYLSPEQDPLGSVRVLSFNGR